MRTPLFRYFLALMLGLLFRPTLAQSTPARGLGEDNVVILLDASWSMTKSMGTSPRISRMAAAKAAIERVVSGDLSPRTRLGLLVFSSANFRDMTVAGDNLGWAFPLGPRDDAKLITQLKSIEPKGSTPLGASMREACSVLRKIKSSSGGALRLLVVTDGQADDPKIVESVLTEAKETGIVIDVIGVGMREDHQLATRVHRYFRANDPGALTSALAQVFAEMASGGLGQRNNQDAFLLVGPLPDQVAEGMIKALVAMEAAGSKKAGK